MKRFYLLLVFIFYIFTITKGYAQEWVPFLLKNGRYSYVKYGSDSITISKQFDDARPFINGFAIVKSKGKWGVIDYEGNYVIDPNYYQINSSSMILFECLLEKYQTQEFKKFEFENYNAFFLRHENSTVKKFELKDQILRNEFNLNFRENVWMGRLIDSIGRNRAPNIYYKTFLDLIDPKDLHKEFDANLGEEDLGDLYYRIEYGNFNSGLCRIKYGDYSRSNYNFLDSLGHLKFKINETKRYSFMGDFNAGLSKVIIKNEDGYRDKFGYIDTNGEELIPGKYDQLGDFKNGLAYAKIDNYSGFINEKGERVLGFKENFFCSSFSDGVAKTLNNNKYEFIDNKGKILFSILANAEKEKIVCHDFHNGIVQINNYSSSNKYFYDINGQVKFQITTKDDVSDFTLDNFALRAHKSVNSSYVTEYFSILDQNGKTRWGKFEKIYLLNDGNSNFTSSSEVNELNDEFYLNKSFKFPFVGITEGDYLSQNLASLEEDFEISFTRYSKNLYKFSLFTPEGLILVQSQGKKYFVDNFGFEYFQK